MSDVVISQIDVKHLKLIRENVVNFMKYSAANYANKKGRLLDIAPQDHDGATPFFCSEITIDTFDINPDANATYTGDICNYNILI